MNNIRKRILPALMALSLVFSPINTIAEDIDIFTGASAGASERPNVLIVLDNTSNWARASQQWPGGITQGQAEVRSIQTVLDSLGSDINVGVMEFVTNGNANDIGGFVRFPILQMDATNKAALKAELQKIYTGITTPEEKRNSGTEYGNLTYDVYNYFAGRDVGINSSNKTGSLNPPSPMVDGRGYDTPYSNFKTPLSKDSSCAKNYVIFIGNPSASGPSSDSAENNLELKSVGCSADPVKLPLFNSSVIAQTDVLGETSGCYTDSTACTTDITKAGTSEFIYDSNSDGIVDSKDKSACVVTSVTEKGKTEYDGKYTISDGAGGQKSGCACTTPVAEVAGGCPTGQYKFPVYGTEAAGATKNLACTANGNCNKLSTVDPANCSGNYSCSCVNDNSCGNNERRVVRKTEVAINQLVGITSSCAATCSTSEFSTSCAKYGGGCVCGSGITGAVSSCDSGKSRFNVTGTNAFILNQPTGAYDESTRGSAWHLDEWAQCLYQKGMPVEGGANQTAAMYTIDVYNKQPNADHTALLMSAAHKGGGRYFSATNEGALINALKKIFAEIQSVNSTFASASLPVNATNRAQNENQVFIGMFRPDPNMQPRWYGNLKRYQLVFEGDGVTVTLGDKNGAVAVNKQTGFVSDCAVSHWTTDSPIDPSDLSKGYYWSNVTVNPNPASKCEGIDPSKVYSDMPDGPTVEKGAVAEVLRKGNNPPTTDSAPNWGADLRKIYTTEGIFDTGIVALADSARLDTGDATRKSWTKGLDVTNLDNPIKEVSGLSTSQTRASLHGDVVHSRPLPVTYGPNDGVIYYGANDGMFRAVDAETGNELWALMPFEFAQVSFVDRLRNNTPLIKYSGISDSAYPSPPQPKTYGWDGSIGIAQDKNNTKVWIYPTMRRGGQMVYALNVTNKNSPSIMWKHGCYGGSCSAGFENMGQTWSAPVVVPVAGYTDEKVALFGGGYDTCEDVDAVSPSCSSPKGANVYVVNAGNGTLLKTFNTTRSVASEVAVVDMDNDGKADYGYVGDTGGNLYRIDMVTRTVVSGAAVYTPLAPSAWTMRKIGKAGDGRKFLFQPALLPISRDGRVYVAIGSGDREHPLASNQAFGVTNRFYVYLDDVRVTSGDVQDLNDLDNRTVDLGCESTSILPGSSKAGWYMDLNQYGKGEQTVTSALILGGQVVFSTNRPIPPAAGTCSTVLGEARGYWLNLFSGSGTISTNAVSCGGDRSSIFVGGGLPPSPVTGNVMVDGKPVTVVIGAVDRDGGASTPISPGKVVPVVKPTRSRIYHKVKGVD